MNIEHGLFLHGLGAWLADLSEAPHSDLAAFLLFPGLFAVGTLLWYQRRPAAASSTSPRDEALAAPAPGRTPIAYRAGLPLLSRELARARRYPHPLSVLVLQRDGAGPPRIGKNGHGGGPTRTEAADEDAAQALSIQIGFLLRDRVRESDIVACDLARDQHVLLLPETDRPRAQAAGRRLVELVRAGYGVRMRCGAAQFHSDGFIVEDLVHRAMAACHGGATDLVPVEED